MMVIERNDRYHCHCNLTDFVSVVVFFRFSSEINSNETSYLIKDLDEQTSYQFRVQTKNTLGYSGWTYSFELPDENGFFTDEEVTSRSAQQILKQAAQSLRDMMKLLQRTSSANSAESTSSSKLI